MEIPHRERLLDSPRGAIRAPKLTTKKTQRLWNVKDALYRCFAREARWKHQCRFKHRIGRIKCVPMLFQTKGQRYTLNTMYIMDEGKRQESGTTKTLSMLGYINKPQVSQDGKWLRIQ